MRQELVRLQQNKDSVDDYYAKMEELANNLGLSDQDCLHIFINGLNLAIKTRLMQDPPTKLEKAYEMALNIENALNLSRGAKINLLDYYDNNEPSQSYVEEPGVKSLQYEQEQPMSLTQKQYDMMLDQAATLNSLTESVQKIQETIRAKRRGSGKNKKASASAVQHTDQSSTGPCRQCNGPHDVTACPQLTSESRGGRGGGRGRFRGKGRGRGRGRGGYSGTDSTIHISIPQVAGQQPYTYTEASRSYDKEVSQVEGETKEYDVDQPSKNE